MSSVAHSLRRIVSRGRTAPAVAASVADEPAPRAPAATAVPVDIAPNDPIIAYFQSAARRGRHRRRSSSSRPRSLALRAAGREDRGAARDPGRADRAAQPRFAALRPGVLGRRPPAAREPRGSGRAGRPRRPARARAGGRDPQPRAPRAGAAGRPADPAALPAAHGARPPGLGRGRRLPARRARSAATSTTSSTLADGQVGIVIGDVTDKGVPAALVMAATRSRAARRGPAADRPGRGAGARERAPRARTSRENMFVTCLYGVLEPRHGPAACSRTPATTCPASRRRQPRRRAAGHAGCRSA